MVSLSAIKRAEYETYQPTFWRKAQNAEEQQGPFFKALIAQENVITLVEKSEGAIRGFIIATLVGSPPVYDPGGLTCLIDDFTVASPTSGRASARSCSRKWLGAQKSKEPFKLWPFVGKEMSPNAHYFPSRAVLSRQSGGRNLFSWRRR